MLRKPRDQIEFKYNFSQYWKLLKKYKIHAFGLLLIVIITEAMYIADKFLFKRIIDDGELFLSGSLETSIFTNTLVLIGAIFIGILVIRSVGKWISEHVLIKLESNLIKDLKTKYFNHILDLSHNFHTTHKAGSLISRLGRGAGAVEGLTDILLYNFAPLVLQLILVSLSLAAFSLVPAIVLAVVTIVFIAYSYFLQRAQEDAKIKHLDAEDREKGFIADVFTNVDSIKYFGKDKFIKSRFDKIVNFTRSRLLLNYGYYRWMSSVQMLILGIGTFFLIYFPVKEFLRGEITLGTLAFIYTIYGNIAGNLFGFVWGMRRLYKTMADFQNLFEYGKIKNEIKNLPHAKNLNISKGEIEFRNIFFSYGRRKLFRNFNLKIKPNEKVALVGHSGCGKTTLVKLLNRFYDLDSGKILIDGEDITSFRQESLRSETGIVPQECILFDDTIYNNIKFARPSATRKEILHSMKLAQLNEIVNNFPDREKTIVGERGVKLSGGEKQRVSIARAILADKKILVLDEATSALDSETESRIQKSLESLLKGRTSIIIAHRLSTIMNADRIIVLKKGKIIEQGSHSELVKRNGEYKKLWNLQKGGYLKD